MTSQQIMKTLADKGSENIKRILMNHGVKEPLFGVKVEELKKIQKEVKKDYKLSKELYATGNADAQYLAGLIADDKKMTKDELQDWMAKAWSSNISQYTVPWVAAESGHGYPLACEWIKSKDPRIAAAGWQTLSSVIAFLPDDQLDIPALSKLLAGTQKTIHTVPVVVRQAMNAFVASTGIYVQSLTEEAMAVARKNGLISSEGGKSAHLPSAEEQIKKAQQRGAIGKKKKTVKC